MDLSVLLNNMLFSKEFINILFWYNFPQLDRRIAAFQQRKRQELDVLNVQEFCTLSGGASTMSSCARTSAVVLRSKDSNSHLKCKDKKFSCLFYVLSSFQFYFLVNYSLP